MAAGKRCCDDDFTTLSSRQQRIAWIAFIVSIIFALILVIYFLAVRPSAFSAQDSSVSAAGIFGSSAIIKEAYSHSNGWRPKCPSKAPKPQERFDCYPEDVHVDEALCYARGCCFTTDAPSPPESTPTGARTDDYGEHPQDPIPKCYYPPNYGYMIDGSPVNFDNGYELPLRRLPSPSRYGNDVEHLRMRVEMQTPYRLRIKFYDTSDERYEVPDPKIPAESDYSTLKSTNGDPQQPRLYQVTYNDTITESHAFGLKVWRSETQTILFDTTVGGFTFAHQFLQISIHLSSFNVYGFGEHEHKRFKHDFKWKTWGMFSGRPSSSRPEKNAGNLYGVHPMYMCIEEGGYTHGVLLLNSNAMEVQLQPMPAVTFRTTGGILDFYLFLGPTPEDVVKQYTEAVGRPVMPPYWALGFHLSRSQYDSIDHIKKIQGRMKVKAIPQDVQHFGIGYMEGHRVFTHDEMTYPDLPKYMDDLHADTQKVMLSVHPGIAREQLKLARYSPYEKGMELRVFINNTWGREPARARMLQMEVMYPDFGNPTAVNWWTDNLRQLKQQLRFDGITLVMNEPIDDESDYENYCLDDNLNRPPYVPKITGRSLTWNTLCMDSVQSWNQNHHRHYDLHSLYGHSSALATAQAMHSISPSHRLLILSESTFVGSGKYVGHFLTNTKSNWQGLAASITRMLEFGLLGIPLVGSDICGSVEEVNEELCQRWLQLGAFYPLARSHKEREFEDQDPAIFCKQFSGIIRKTLLTRYELLPYLYTLFYQAHTTGSTVARPLFHEFWKDWNTYSNDRQFLWGPALMISPVLVKNSSSISVYFPSGVWYDYYTGDALVGTAGWKILQPPLPDIRKLIPLHIRGGHIIPAQVPGNTTTLSRKNPMKLHVALDGSLQATGHLFWDDGETMDSHLLGEYVFVTFNAAKDKLTVSGTAGKQIFSSDFNQLYIETVRIMGLPWKPTLITINGNYYLTKKQYNWHPGFKVLILEYILIPLTETTVIQWFWR